MAIVLENALLADWDPPNVEAGALLIAGDRIVQRDSTVSRQAEDLVFDCRGAVVLPGLVNGHAHLYAALAAGLPAPPRAPRNFVEILEYLWWRLDRALDAESIEMSGRIGALDAVRCGTTTLIDHHASPNCIDGSLDFLQRGIAHIGLRAVLCYETTDRNGRAGRAAGIAENARYLAMSCAEPDQQFAGLAGAHASFTLEDETLDELAALAERFSSGVHIHVGEDPTDELNCREKHHRSLIDRLAEHGLLTPRAVFAHGTHLDAGAIAKVNEMGPTMVHNPRSNMNNSVGYAPVAAFRCPVMLGTDGIGSDMFTEAKQAWFKACDARAGLTPGDVLRMLATSSRRASTALGVTLGKLTVDAAADVVITDYRPATPLSGNNLSGHFLYAMGSPHVASVIIKGRCVMRDREVVACDEPALRREARDVTTRLWRRMATIE